MGEMCFPSEDKSWEDVERSVLKTLAVGGVDKGLAREMIKELSGIEILTHYPLKPFPYGVIAVDGIAFDLVLDRDGVRKLADSLLGLPRLDKLEFFPYGIIDPQLFNVHTEFRL